MDFSEWYYLVQNYTADSVIINDVPPSFVEYLKGDSSIKYFDAEEAEELFGSFFRSVNSAISDLGGSVFVKMSNKAPMDSQWIMMGKQLLCQEANDVALVLKASQIIQKELCDSVGSPVLVLRKFTEYHPAGEFRCFIVDRKLKGISQKKISSHFPFLKEELDLSLKIQNFVTPLVAHLTFPFSRFAVDVYYDFARNAFSIIDFTAWSDDRHPDLLLFTMDDLMDSNDTIFQIADEDTAHVNTASESLEAWPDDLAVFTQDPTLTMEQLGRKIFSSYRDEFENQSS